MINSYIDIFIIILLFITALIIPKNGTGHKLWILLYFGVIIIVHSIYLFINNADTLVLLQEYIIPIAGFTCSVLLVIWLIKINKRGNIVQ